jgi:pyridoxine 5-phosphate synthase
MLKPLHGKVEFNIEGDPRPDLIALVRDVRPDQCTLVPVRPGEITSQAGWSPETPRHLLERTIRDLKADGIRVSLFVDPLLAPAKWAAEIGADRIELYTEPYARAFERGVEAAHASFADYAEAATYAHALGLGVNAGHDLDLDNLVIISHALFVGLAQAVREYLDVLAQH